MNENIIIVTAVLICASSSVLCFHGVEQLEADCFKNEPYLWGKLAFKPMPWFNSTRLINPACLSHFCLFGSNPGHHFLLHITLREERKVGPSSHGGNLRFGLRPSVCVSEKMQGSGSSDSQFILPESAAWFCRPLFLSHFSSRPFGWMFPNQQPWFSLQEQVRDQDGFHYGIPESMMAEDLTS